MMLFYVIVSLKTEADMDASAVQRIVITAHTQRPSVAFPRQLWGKSPEVQTLCEPVCCLLLLQQIEDRQAGLMINNAPVCWCSLSFPLAQEGNE